MRFFKLVAAAILSLAALSCNKIDNRSKHTILGVDLIGKWALEDGDLEDYWEFTKDGYLRYYEIEGGGYAEIHDNVIYQNDNSWELNMKGNYAIEDSVIFFEGMKRATIVKKINDDKAVVRMFYAPTETVTMVRVKDMKKGWAPESSLQDNVFLSKAHEHSYVLVRMQSGSEGKIKFVERWGGRYSFFEENFKLSLKGKEGVLTTESGLVFDVMRQSSGSMTFTYKSEEMLYHFSDSKMAEMKRAYKPGDNTKIWYLSSDYEIVEPTLLEGYDSKGKLLSYTNMANYDYRGYECIEFDGEVKTIGMSFGKYSTSEDANLEAFMGISNKVKMKDSSASLINPETGEEVGIMSNCLFGYCSSVRFIDMDCFDTQDLTGLRLAFAWCLNLEALDIDEFDTRNVKSFEGTFLGLSALKGTLDLNHLSFENATSTYKMFSDTKSLNAILVEGFNFTNQLERTWRMFYKTGARTIKVGCDNFTGEFQPFSQSLELPKASGTFYYKQQSTGDNWANKLTSDYHDWTLVAY